MREQTLCEAKLTTDDGLRYVCIRSKAIPSGTSDGEAWVTHDDNSHQWAPDTSPAPTRGIDPEDAARELDKAVDVLQAAARHFDAVATANAALHLAETVRPSPLAIRVETAADEARRSAMRFRNVG